MSNNLTALGLELEWDDDQEFTISPANAMVIAEGFDSDGDTVHVVMATPGMTSVKGAGFVSFAKQWIDLKMMNEIVRASTPEEEF